MTDLPAHPTPLLTIGYESARFEQVRDALTGAGTRLLVDVRAIASSRRAGFSKRILAGGLAEAGIEYVHLQPLGTPKDGRDAVRRGDVGTMVRIFQAHMEGDRSQAALQEARALATERRACLLCFERDHTHCHRSLVADMIVGQTGQPVHHLLASIDTPEPVRTKRIRKTLT
ncbi:DUF488 domain-containing protein [Lichenicola cladoniae]|uniref:DUF488 domain-containing protein n=1 Tax=Lichenicola cladoniae TaxID=1484109 RepID=A0A6M8HQ50_9PROT|nr:DUF488 domain-containing protein [Lichenicola cladoniae]NPD67964.1 DUF488 domain-containing protein [Acetobacteraceae bacterium]QKE90554.1 DUF488 domain-containing protein [Lichenicola cladoniae]